MILAVAPPRPHFFHRFLHLPSDPRRESQNRICRVGTHAMRAACGDFGNPWGRGVQRIGHAVEAALNAPFNRNLLIVRGNS